MDQSSKRELIARLERDALHLCARFGLRYRVLEAERANVKRRYGVCFSDGTIRIRLRHATTGRALKYSSLVNTLCHELAHLQHFNHGPRFQALYARILECARRDGIYRPRQAMGWDPRFAAPSATLRSGLASASRPIVPSATGLTARPTASDPRGIPIRRSAPPALQLDLFSSSGREADSVSLQARTGPTGHRKRNEVGRPG